MTVNVALPTLLLVSVAEQVTVVTPCGKTLPEGTEQVTLSAPSTMSTAEAAYVTGAPDGPVAATVIFAGTVTVGAVVSLTVTVNCAVPTLARESVAEQVTVEVPSENRLPEGERHVTATEPSTWSIADASNVAMVPVGPAASSVMFAGTWTLGGVVSTTVTVKLAVATFSLRSTAEQTTVVSPNGNSVPDW
jgi:hypothetical protein